MTSSMAMQPATASGSGLTVMTQSAPPARVARHAGCMAAAHGAQSVALILATPAPTNRRVQSQLCEDFHGADGGLHASRATHAACDVHIPTCDIANSLLFPASCCSTRIMATAAWREEGARRLTPGAAPEVNSLVAHTQTQLRHRCDFLGVCLESDGPFAGHRRHRGRRMPCDQLMPAFWHRQGLETCRDDLGRIVLRRTKVSQPVCRSECFRGQLGCHQ